MKKKIQIKTVRGKYRELFVPATTDVCPVCERRCTWRDLPVDCSVCDGATVVLVVTDSFWTTHPTIYEAFVRNQDEEEALGWEQYGERKWNA